MNELIVYKDVEIHQADQIVLHDVNISVQGGEMIYLLGKVGSGKSSLMKTFYGALPVQSGEARVLDYDMRTIERRQLPYLRRRLGIIFQDYKLLTDRSVEENLLFVLRATGWKDKALMQAHVHEVLEQVGMDTKAYKKPYELSGGEQQRVVIARALLNTPEMILADEPTGNLDAETGREIMELLYAISQAGITVLMSTHNLQWPEQFPGKKWLFANGENPMPESEKTEQNKIDGCQSTVWFSCKYEDGKLWFNGDSEALLVKGIVAMLLYVLSGSTPKEILETELYFIERIGLQEHLSPTRSNGVVAMLKQLRLYALAYNS